MTKFKVDIKNSLVRYERELKNNDRIIFGAATTFLVVFPIKEYNEDNQEDLENEENIDFDFC